MTEKEKAYQDCLASQTQVTNVLAHTTIPEIYKVGQESRIKIKWKESRQGGTPLRRGNIDMPFTAFDLNSNGKLDYIEWIVPHLSDQVFEIIFISKAFELDQNKEIIADIYDQVKAQDGTWADGTYATVPSEHYVRVTFEQVLDNTKDITIYARPNLETQNLKLETQNDDGSQVPSSKFQVPSIEVYPVYTDADGNTTQGELVAVFDIVDREDTYKVLLTSLAQPTDTFDLKIVRGE